MTQDRNTYLIQALVLVDMLQRKEGVTYQKIMERFEVSYKTAKRWMQAAEEVLPIQVDEGDKGRGECHYFRLVKR